MERIKLDYIKEEIFYEKLSNGLDIYLYCKDGVTNNYVTFTTKFGSIYHDFVPVGKSQIKTFPCGIAHFLEHKVFAQKKGPQPEEFFAQSGTLCNAYTTFKNTTYLFSGPDDLEKNTLYLLDFVQSPYFTKENVESERGIITQEIHMCDDNPTDIMYEHIRKNSFYHNPFRDSIIGTVDDINSIDENILNECYQTFYHPSNMFLVITGNFDVQRMLDAIKQNQSIKKFKSILPIKTKSYNEPNKVVKSKEIISFDTPIPKVAYTIKVSLKDIGMDIRKYNLYLFILFSCLFDDSSDFDYEAKKENLITDSMGLNLLNCDSHVLVSLISETLSYDGLIQKIEKNLKNLDLSEEDLERKKKVLISNELFSFENIEVINDMVVDNIIFDNKIENNMIDLLKSLNRKELNEVIDSLNLENKAIVILKNNN